MATLSNPQGQTVNIQVTPKMELQFDFNPGDETQLERIDDDLVFHFDDGGQIVLDDFYAQETEDLPSMDIMGASIGAEDFLASLGDETLLPAAGPTAGPAQGTDSGGSGAYGDDAGNLIGGVDYLGMLGRSFWGRATETPIDQVGLAMPDGDFSWGLMTIGVGAAAYEDAQPFQNTGDYTEHLASLQFTFTSPNGSWVDGVQLQGFHAGTEIFIDGVSQGLCSGPDQVYDFTYAQLTSGAGVQLKPPFNSDADMDITGNVTIANVGGTEVRDVAFSVVVDAVADMPGQAEAEVGAEGIALQDGVKDAANGEAKSVSVDVQVAFGDAYDTTEQQFVEIRGVPGWGINDQGEAVNTGGWVVSGTPAHWNYLGAFVVDDENGNPMVVHRFEVTEAARLTADPDSHEAVVSGSVEFNPGDWTSSGAQDPASGQASPDLGRDNNGNLHSDGPADLGVRGTSQDNPQDEDFDYSNNTATGEWTNLEPIDIVEDTPDIELSGKILFTDEQPWQQPYEGDWETAWGEFSAATKGIIDTAAGEIGAVNIPYGIKVSGSSSSPVLGASTTTVSYNLYSDGKADGAGEAGANAGQTKLDIDLAASNLPTMAKFPEDLGYSEIIYETYTDAAGNVCILGYIENGSGKHLAISITLEPGSLEGGAGTGNLSVVQYLAFQHQEIPGNNRDAYDIRVTVTDDDGDTNYVDVRYLSEDDTPRAVGETHTLDETQVHEVSGNVLLNDEAKADGWYGGGASVPGSNVENQGVESWEIKLPDGYSLQAGDGKFSVVEDGQPNLDLLGPQTYTILGPNGQVAGTLTLNTNGDYSFVRNPEASFTKDFDINVKYWVRDADGDRASANLEIKVDAAPLVVGISGQELVFESGQGDAQGYAAYTLQVYDYEGRALDADSLYEAITVTLKINPGTATLADFDFEALEALNPGLTFVDKGGGVIEVTIPADAANAQVEIKLPFADDHLGGRGTTSDGPYEEYNVEVIGVAGAGDPSIEYLDPKDSHYADLPGVHTSQDTAVLDDGVELKTDGDPTDKDDYIYSDNRISQVDGDGGYDHKTDEHRLDGPMFGLDSSVGDSGTVAEGGSAIFTLRAGDPASDNGGKYTETLAEKVVLTIDISYLGGASGDDFEDLTWLNTSGLNPKPSYSLSSDGQTVTITLPKGFDMSKIGQVGFQVNTKNDNLENEDGEGYNVAISGVSGNESSYYGDAKVVDIEDPPLNKLGIAGDSNVWEGGTLKYAITYETTAKIDGDNTDTVEFILKFGGTGDNEAAWGADYTIGDIITANPHLTFQTADGAAIDPDRPETWPTDGRVKVIVEPDDWTVDNSADAHGYYQNTVELAVPTKHDNQIGENDETVTIVIDETSVKGGEIDPDSVSSDAAGTIQDRAEISLTATDYSGKTHNIHEDAGDGPTVATYQVNFKHADGVGADEDSWGNMGFTGAGDVAASAFNFDITVRDGSGATGAKFDANMQDNVGYADGNKDADTHDYGWAVPTFGSDGEITGYELIPYGDLSDPANQQFLMDTINEALEAQGFEGIRVVGVSNGGKTLTFQVDEGADLSRPLPVQVGAVDDRITEPTEDYSVILNNIKASDPTLGEENVVIGKDRQVDTDIVDDATTRGDGFYVGVGPSEGNESDKQIDLNIHLFQRDSAGNVVEADPKNPPSQAIKVTFNVGRDGDAADIDEDYYVNSPKGNNTHEVTLGSGEGNWQFVDGSPEGGEIGQPGYVPGHWVYIGADANIPLNDDRLSEGDESFSVEVGKVSGHESSPLPEDVKYTDENGETIGKGTDEMVIKDDYSRPGEGADELDGPDLDYFGPAGQVIEPVAPDKPGPTVETGTIVKDVNAGFTDTPQGTYGELQVDGLVFKPAVGEVRGNPGQFQLGQEHADLVVTDDGGLGVGSAGQPGSSVYTGEGIVISSETGAALTGLQLSVITEGYGGSIRYQIYDADGRPYGDQVSVPMQGMTPGSEFTLNLPDLPAGYSVAVYSMGENSWHLGGASGQTEVPGETQVVEDSDVFNTVNYKVIMTDDVAQDTIAFIDIKNENFADYEPVWASGETFPGTEGTLGVYDPSGVHGLTWADIVEEYPHMAKYGEPPAVAAGEVLYFVIIPEGKAAAEFGVQIKHDHDTTKDNDRGIDKAGEESINMEIVDILGSENVFRPGEDYAKSDTEILDDMHGPAVSFTHLSSAQPDQPVELTVKIGQAATEDVVVKIAFTDASGNVTYGYVTIPAGQTECVGNVKASPEPGAADFKMPNSAYVYAQIVESDGGESQRDSDVDYIKLGGGQGGSEGLLGVNVRAEDIYEGGRNAADSDEPKSVTYEIDFSGVADYSGNGFSFTIRTVNNSTGDQDFEGDAPGSQQGESENTDVRLDFNQDFLDDLIQGKDFTLKIVPDADGNPAKVTVEFKDGSQGLELSVDPDGKVSYNQTEYGTVTGKLPTAYDDKLIEGDETFTPIVVNPGGVEPTGDPNEVTIKDNDTPIVRVVYCDQFGEPLPIDPETNLPYGLEGGEAVYCKVQVGYWEGGLEGGTWVPLTLANGQATFNLSGSSSTAAQSGTDYVIEQDSVVIPNQASESAPVKVYLPEDYKSDGDQKLQINAEYENGANKVNNYEGILTDKDSGAPASGSSGELLIKEHLNGPEITFSSDRDGQTVGEHEAINYWVTLDSALEEKAELTFRVYLETDNDGNYLNTADGFVLEDIKYIQVNGKTYAMDYSEEDGFLVYEVTISGGKETGRALVDAAESPIARDADGNLEVRLDMADGASKDGFSITLANDPISEGKYNGLPEEEIRVELVGSQGGELLVRDPSDDKLKDVSEVAEKPAVGSTVTDTLDGPKVGLEAVAREGVEGGSVDVNITLSKDTVSETTIELQLGKDAAKGIDVANQVVDGNSVDVVGRIWDPDQGPNGGYVEYRTTGSIDPATGKVTIVLPAGVKGPLTVTFPLKDNMYGGDESAHLNPDFSVSLDGAGISGGEAGLAGGSSYAGKFNGESNISQTFILDGPESVPADGVCTISLKGAEYVDYITFKIDGTQYTISGSQFQNGKYSLDGKIGVSLDGVEVKVVFKTDLTDEQMAKAKLETGVSAGISGMEVTVEVKDDPESWDGPKFGVVAEETSYDDTAATAVFIISGQGYATGFTDAQGNAVVNTVEDITITFKLTGDYAGQATGVSLPQALLDLGYKLEPGANSGEYKLTVPAGRPLAEVASGLKVTVETSGSDGKVEGNHELGLEITGASGNEAGLGAGSSAATEIVDTDRPDYVLSGGASVSEDGGEAVFYLTSDNTGVTQQETVITFKLGGSHVDGAKVFWNGGEVEPESGVYTIRVPAGTNLAQLNQAVKVVVGADDRYSGDNDIQLVEVTTNYGAMDASGAQVELSESGVEVVFTPGELSVLEGGSINFGLNIRNAASGEDAALSQTMLVTILVSGYEDQAAGLDAATVLSGLSSDIGTIAGASWDDAAGGWTVSLEIPAGHSNANLSIQTLADGLIENPEGLSVAVKEISYGGEEKVAYVDDQGSPVVADDYAAHYTITDGESAHIPAGLEDYDLTGLKLGLVDGDGNYDGSGEHTLGQLILGNEDGNIIIGGHGNDVIIGGHGNDTLTGGLGDDVFVWQAGDQGDALSPARDVITDFSMNGDGVNGGFGDDVLDLRDLFSIGEGKSLDNYLSISNDGDHAVIQISTTGDVGAAVDQVIVLQDVYSNHSGDEETINALIKQHILTDSGGN